MADGKDDPKDPIDPKDPADPDGGDGGGDPDPKDPKGGADPEPKVPLSRLREEVTKRERAERALDALRGGKPEEHVVPESEKGVREVLSKIEREKADADAQHQKEWDTKMDELKTIHGEFNQEHLGAIINKYGLFNPDQTVKWEEAMDLYNRLGGNPNPPPVKRKVPPADRGGSGGGKPEKVDVRGKSMHQLSEESKAELG